MPKYREFLKGKVLEEMSKYLNKFELETMKNLKEYNDIIDFIYLKLDFDTKLDIILDNLFLLETFKYKLLKDDNLSIREKSISRCSLSVDLIRELELDSSWSVKQELKKRKIKMGLIKK